MQFPKFGHFLVTFFQLPLPSLWSSAIPNLSGSYGLSRWDEDAPDRTPWGFIRLRNATSNEMAHVSFYRKEWGSEPVSVLPSSYGKGEEARVALPEGEYNVTWDIIDGDTGTKLGSWIYRGVMVHQGRNDDAATVRISTVDGERVE